MTARRVEDLDTPCLVVDLDVVEANVARAFERLAAVDVRPHQKTAKSPDLARLLLAAGARGVCVAKLGEAEVMLDGGIDDVLITTELIGPIKMQRLAALRERHPGARIAVVVDSVEGAAALPPGVEVLLEVNVGQDRCGVAPDDAVALADRLDVILAGVQGYEGNLQLVRDLDERRRGCDESMARLAAAVGALRAAGHAVPWVTTGGTGTAEFCAAHDVVTEVQPGSFVFSDAAYMATGAPYAPALTVTATVISRPAPGRAVVDAGLKTLTDDHGPARLADLPGWTYAHAGDEHGILTGSGEEMMSPSATRGPTSPRPHGVRLGTPLGIGDRVTLIPSHGDTTVNLHDVLHVHRGGVIEAVWPVVARGRVR